FRPCGEAALEIEQGGAHFGDHRHLARQLSGLGARQNHGVEMAGIDRARRGDGGRLETRPVLEPGDGPAHGAVEQPGVEMRQPVMPGKARGERALARGCRSIHRDDHCRPVPARGNKRALLTKAGRACQPCGPILGLTATGFGPNRTTSCGRPPRFPRGKQLAQDERGTKREDPETGKKYYDLNKDPIVSPYTGKSYPRSFFEQNAVAAVRAKVAERTEDEDEDDVETEEETAEPGAPEIVSLEDADAEEAGDEEGEAIPEVE